MSSDDLPPRGTDGVVPGPESATAGVVVRLAVWQRTRNHLAIGNLGEHVTARLLASLGYRLLGAQDDFVGMVSEVLGEPTKANPEDFIAIDPDERLVTINSKASVGARSCRITAAGDLSAPRMSRHQRALGYSTLRANLISPVDGDAFSQVVKVDLAHMRAQVFDIGEDGRLARTGAPHDVAAIAASVLAEFPDVVPPPNVGDLN